MADLELPSSVPQDARHRRDRIKLLLTSLAEKTNKVGIILDEAQTKGDHVTLGYKSWTAYMLGEYAGELADLDRAKRREVVGSLTAAGMSTRAIAGVVGTSHKTVVKDLQVQVVPEVPPDLVDHQDGVDRRVTGIDGKSYSKLHTVPSRPVIEPRTMRQTSLPKQYFAAVRDLEKAVRRLEKLHSNDRFGANRKALLDLHLPHLTSMQVLLEKIEQDLFNGNLCHVCDKRVPAGLDFGSTRPMCRTCAAGAR